MRGKVLAAKMKLTILERWGSGTAECPMSILSACEYLLEEVALNSTNGKFTGYGENTAGCEHLSYWCSHHKGSWTNDSFKGKVRKYLIYK